MKRTMYKAARHTPKRGVGSSNLLGDAIAAASCIACGGFFTKFSAAKIVAARAPPICGLSTAAFALFHATAKNGPRLSLLDRRGLRFHMRAVFACHSGLLRFFSHPRRHSLCVDSVFAYQAF